MKTTGENKYPISISNQNDDRYKQLYILVLQRWYCAEIRW